jgi:hypothetical protein
MKLFLASFSLALLALAGCSDESVTLFDGRTAHSKTEKGQFAVPIALRAAPAVKSAEAVSLDTLLATARSELKHYTDVPDTWKFASIHAYGAQVTEAAYQVHFRKEWDGWIIVVVGADGSVRGRPTSR